MMDDNNTVLVVDDDPGLLVSVWEMLKNDYEVSSAKSGRDALDMLAKGYVPDMVLLDIDMPGLNGFETLALIGEMEDMRDVPVMFLTGVTEAEAEVKGLKSGAVDYIRKPFVKANLLARLKVHLENGRRIRWLSMLEKNKTGAEIDEAKFEKAAADLTDTEKKILRLIAIGYSNQEIGDTLNYSNSYVRKIVSKIYEKNYVGSRFELQKLIR
jgi:DNA-binding NarL/FixJ family response regulator